ncbi:hypothetical protein [Streptomyces sp. AS02]|uniref:hypothetical protein n=1 Tax=Streptomyces sp. AS02 TaxID=2938946 RepID=UPI002021688D|nr:hypothetical protein [Streptomyces sp. AS02]MCL8011708.1 hypothetical protein [Streptomyces sp. AS02]
MFVAATAVGCTAAATTDPAGSGRNGQGRELTDTEEVLTERAEERLVKQCMERAGFRYWEGPIVSAEQRKGYGYVLDDVEWAKKYGFGGQLEAKAQQDRRRDPNISYLKKLSQAERARYDKALDGDGTGRTLSVELPTGGTVRTPGDGCRAEAKDHLYGDYETWFRVKKTAESLTPLYVPDLTRSERFVKALKEWSDCMRKAGHDYADPPRIRAELEELVDGLSPAEAHAVEVPLAVDEATCASTTSLADTARGLEREFRDKNLARYSDEIAAYQDMRLAALARAKDIAGPAG